MWIGLTKRLTARVAASAARGAAKRGELGVSCFAYDDFYRTAPDKPCAVFGVYAGLSE